MALSASKATTFTVPVKVTFLGDLLHMDVQPIVMEDDEFKDEMNKRAYLSYSERVKLEEAGEEIPARTYFDYDYGISRVVTNWDYLGDDKMALPITEDIVSEWPWQLKVTVWEAILEAVSPKALTQPTRGTGSARKAR